MPATVIFNEHAPLGTRDAIRMVVAAALPSAEEQLRDRLVDEACVGGGRQMPSADLLRWLQERVAGPEIAAHLREVAENRAAYAPSAAQNPEAVWYPNSERDPECPRLIEEELPWARRTPLIDRTTPIGSAGSCFASEISRRLRGDGYNYLITEPDPGGASVFPARWGIIFNAPSLRLLVERAFGIVETPKLLWRDPRDPDRLRDPFREHVFFRSAAEYEADRERHLEATRRALLEAEVFVLTLGVNEVWRLKGDGSPIARTPWGYGSPLVQRSVLTVQDNVDALQAMLDAWRRENPAIQLIVTVSPVPLLATFRAASQHVVTASSHSKATLRVAAEQFANANDGVHYFPSFETVMYCSGQPWKRDNRHVKRETVSRVMRLFDACYVADAAWNAARSHDPQCVRCDIDDAPESFRVLLALKRDDDELAAAATRVWIDSMRGDDDAVLIMNLPAGGDVDRTAAVVRSVLDDAGLCEDEPIVTLRESDARSVDSLIANVDVVLVPEGRESGPIARRARERGVATERLCARSIREHRSANLELQRFSNFVARLLSSAQLTAPERAALEELREGYIRFAALGVTPPGARAVLRDLQRIDPGAMFDHMGDVFGRAWPPQFESPDPAPEWTEILRREGRALDPRPSDLLLDLTRFEREGDECWVDHSDLVRLAPVQEAATSSDRLDAVRHVLGCEPILDVIAGRRLAAGESDAFIPALDRPMAVVAVHVVEGEAHLDGASLACGSVLWCDPARLRTLRAGPRGCATIAIQYAASLFGARARHTHLDDGHPREWITFVASHPRLCQNFHS